MQITFDPKTADLGEATCILGMILPAFVKGCKQQGDTLAEVQAGVADLLTHTWGALEAAAEKDA